MANIVFKRGYQAAFDAMTTVEDGVFYLTRDTGRLYVGEGTTKKLLNQTVQIVPTVTDLELVSAGWTTPQAQLDHVNDFYYITDPNILAVWNYNTQKGIYEWHQINPDSETWVASQAFSQTATNNIGTVTLTTTMGGNDHSNYAGQEVDAEFTLQTENGINLSTTSNGLIISGNTYSLSRSINNNAATVQLSSTNLSTTSGFSIYGGEHVTISTSGTSGIVVSADDNSIKTATFAINNGTLSLTMSNDSGDTVPASIGILGVELNNGTYAPLNDMSGKTAGAIYSKAEVDNLIRGLDGMTYKGTITSSDISGTVHALPTTNVRNGDTYLVGSSGVSVAAGAVVDGSVPATGPIVGDMFIAKGIEGSDGYISSTVQWAYIPSGNDSLSSVTYTTTVTANTNSIGLNNGEGDGVAAISLIAGTDIAISSTASAYGSTDNVQLTSTINHATITTTSTSTSATGSVSAITALTISNGHITGYETTSFEAETYQLSSYRSTATTVTSDIANGTRMATATNSGLNDLSFATTLATSGGDLINSSIVKLTSSTIKLSKGNDGEVVMNMEWGTF